MVQRWLPTVGALLVLLLTAITLLWGENAGLSDNGDFARVMQVNRIHPTGDGQSAFLFQQYYAMDLDGTTTGEQMRSLFTTQDDGLYDSPQFAFVQASKFCNYVYNRLTGANAGNYNLLFLALLYAPILAAAVWLILRHLPRGGVWRRLLTAAVLLFLFCDAGYLLYFHSFYGEALQYVTLMLAVGLWLRLYENPRRLLSWIVFYLALYFFGGAKLANVPLACLFGLAALLLLLRTEGKRMRIAVCALCALLMVSQVSLYLGIPNWMENDTNYQAVFFGVLKNSDTPEADLEELGLDPAYAPLAGTNAYQTAYPMDIYTDAFRDNFYPNVSKLRVMLFYLRHPVRLVQKLDTAVMCSAYIRPPYLGNVSSERLLQIRRCSGWSRMRVQSGILYRAPIVLPMMTVLSLAVLWLFWRSFRRKKTEQLSVYGALLAVCIALWAALMLPVFSNGEADLSKHMFLFVHLMDGLLAMGIVAAAPYVVRGIKAGLRHPKPTCIGAGVVLACVLVALLIRGQSALPMVEFGQFEGKPLRWDVVREEEDTMTLVCRETVTERPFDEKGGNLWSDSTLRGWLGSAFLAEFSPEELERLVVVEQRELLSDPYAAQREGGDHPLFWHFDPRKAADLTEQSYYKTTMDTVYLPTPELFGEVRAKCGADWWMLAPYGNNGYMERVVGRDGFVLLRDTQTAAGVRPAVTVRKK